MIIKFTILLLLVLMLWSMGSALFYMMKDGDGSVRMAKALTWRICLSVGTFAFLMLAYWLGWITPHPLVIGV